MNIHSILLTVHVLVAITLIGLVMIQQGRGADAGAAFGSGSAGSVFGARGPASFLTRATAALATIFFVTSLTLGYLAAHREQNTSVVESVDAPPLAPPSDLPQVPTPTGAGAPTDMPSLPQPGNSTQ